MSHGVNLIPMFQLLGCTSRFGGSPLCLTVLQVKLHQPTNTSQIFFQETATEVGEALAEGMEDTMEADTEEVMEEGEGITMAGA